MGNLHCKIQLHLYLWLLHTTFGAYHGHFQKFLSCVAKIAVATQAIDPCKEKHFVSYWNANILFSIARSTAKYAMLAASSLSSKCLNCFINVIIYVVTIIVCSNTLGILQQHIIN